MLTIRMHCEGTDYDIMVPYVDDLEQAFRDTYKGEFGFAHPEERRVVVEVVRVRVLKGVSDGVSDGTDGIGGTNDGVDTGSGVPVGMETYRTWLDGLGWTDCPVSRVPGTGGTGRGSRAHCTSGLKCPPRLWVGGGCGWEGRHFVDIDGDGPVRVGTSGWGGAARLALYGHCFMGLAEEMGGRLGRDGAGDGVSREAGSEHSVGASDNVAAGGEEDQSGGQGGVLGRAWGPHHYPHGWWCRIWCMSGRWDGMVHGGRMDPGIGARHCSHGFPACKSVCLH